MTAITTTEWIITPRVGIGPVLLGADRKDLRSEMSELGFGLSSDRPTIDYFSDTCMAVEYDEADRVQHIGLFHDARIIPTYHGHDVFGISALKLFSLIADHDQSGPHSFVRSEYRFPGQILTLYDASSQYNYRQNTRDAVWMQVGIGNAAYLKAINDLINRV